MESSTRCQVRYCRISSLMTLEYQLLSAELRSCIDAGSSLRVFFNLPLKRRQAESCQVHLDGSEKQVIGTILRSQSAKATNSIIIFNNDKPSPHIIWIGGVIIKEFMGGKKKKQVEQQQLRPKGLQITELMDKSDMDKTEFISFLPQDAVYTDKAYIVKGDLSLKIVMRELLKQLNWLRYLSFKEFWATVQFNLSLKYCLESCLLFLQRRKYNEYLHIQVQSDAEEDTQQFKDKLPKDNEVIEYQQHIYQILMIIYFRIVQAEDEDPHLAKQYRCYQSVYDNWVLDIPKLFNFMDIYGESNPDLTRILVEKVFQINSDFKLDYLDVLKMMSTHIFKDIFQQFKFLHDRSEFQKQITEDTLRKKMKHFLLIKDITTSFLNVFEFFPLDVKIYVISSAVLGPLENLYYQIFEAYKNWEFNQFKESVHSLMDSIQEDLIKVWRHIFELFRRVILEETNLSYISDFYDIKDAAIQNMNALGEEFGTVVSQGKKGKEKRNYMLLEQILEEFDLKEFLDELLDLQNKKIDKQRIKQLLNVVQKLTQLKEKRMRPEQQIIQQKQETTEVDEKANTLPQTQNIRKQSTHKFQNAGSKQQKEDKINTRMEKVRRPQRIEKTNQREYDDEYDDYYDFNRKVEENKPDSDDEIEQIPDNPNRRYRNDKNKELEKSTNTGNKSHYQQKNNKYLEKKVSKEMEKPFKKEGNRDDGSKKGDRRENFKPGGQKKQYRQK